MSEQDRRRDKAFHDVHLALSRFITRITIGIRHLFPASRWPDGLKPAAHFRRWLCHLQNQALPVNPFARLIGVGHLAQALGGVGRQGFSSRLRILLAASLFEPALLAA